MGAEVIEAKDNWNYSRGLLFWYAIRLYHFGFRAKYTFNDKYALTGFLTNGWNDVVDNNSGKTYGASFGWTPNKKWAVTETGFFGPEQANYNKTWRQTYDTITYNRPASCRWPTTTTVAADRPVDPLTLLPTPTAPIAWWSGIAGYVKYAWNDKSTSRPVTSTTTTTADSRREPCSTVNEFTTTLQRSIRQQLADPVGISTRYVGPADLPEEHQWPGERPEHGDGRLDSDLRQSRGEVTVPWLRPRRSRPAPRAAWRSSNAQRKPDSGGSDSRPASRGRGERVAPILDSPRCC